MWLCSLDNYHIFLGWLQNEQWVVLEFLEVIEAVHKCVWAFQATHYYISYLIPYFELKEKPWLFLYWATKDLYYKAWKTMKIPLLWDRGTTQKGKRNKEKKKCDDQKEVWTYLVQSKEVGSKSQSKRKRKKKWKKLKELNEKKRKRTW